MLTLCRHVIRLFRLISYHHQIMHAMLRRCPSSPHHSLSPLAAHCIRRLIHRARVLAIAAGNPQPSTSLTVSAANTTTRNNFTVYDEHLKLLAGLNEPLAKGFSSPLIQPGRTKEDYMQLLQEQNALEKDCFAKVRNVARRDNKFKLEMEPMERVVEGWEWREQLEADLDKIVAEESLSSELMDFFGQIDRKRLADQLFTLLLSILCRGKSSVPVSEVNENLYKIIGNLFQPERNLVSVGNQIDSEKIFKEYMSYFTEGNSAAKREHTIRDWWCKCARKFDFDPTDSRFYPSSFVDIPRKKVVNKLLSMLIYNCEFPPYEVDWHRPEIAKQGSANAERKKQPKPKRAPDWIRAFGIQDVVVHEQNTHEGLGKKTSLCKMLTIHRQIVHSYGRAHQFEHLYFPSHLLPMKVPPRPWLDRGRCGPSYVSSQKLVRDFFPDMDVNQEMLNERIGSGEQARPVFDALNLLGATAWQINEDMLKHLKTALDMSHSHSNKKLNFLKKVSIPACTKSTFTWKYQTFEHYLQKAKVKVGDLEDKVIKGRIEKGYKDYVEKWQKTEKTRKEQNSLWCWLVYRLSLAQHFAAGQVLYFPHNIDFRGRAYPISPQINHMGDDVNRALLKFARGKPLGSDGFRWLKLHCVNITGRMKRAPLRERLAYAEAHLDQIVRAAERPFQEEGDWWWRQSEEPWQTLATCIEIRNALEGGRPEEYSSQLPVHQDGSCNGLQHYAALGRDLKGAREVNLLPEDRPQDIYTTVVESVEKMRIEDELNAGSKHHEVAKELRGDMPGPLKRKIIKQTVMTTVYGVTMFGARGQIRRQLVDIGITEEKASKFSTYLARRTFDGLTDAFQNSIGLMDWFKACAQQILRNTRRPVEWVTPLGLPVVQPYVRFEKVDNKLWRLPIAHKQKNAFPPNFVHSLDSTHMMLTALHCYRAGITYASVHDCFWTHACDVDQMNRICREQFIALHKEPIVQKLSESFSSTYLTEQLRSSTRAEAWKGMEQKFRPPSKPGELDIDQVRESVYFFS